MSNEANPNPEDVPFFSLEAYSLAQRVAIVSGGSDGIGRMIAHGFADAGARVVIAARGEEKITKVVAEIEAKGHRAVGIPTDATDPDAIEHLVNRTVTEFGQIDILMNVVGGSQGPTFKRGPLLELSKEDFNEAFNALTSPPEQVEATVPFPHGALFILAVVMFLFSSHERRRKTIVR